MPDQDMFNDENNTSNTPVTTDNPSNPFVDQLSEIKNDNGEPKYKSVEDALSALNHSQKHISTIESEREADRRKIQELENELNTRKSVEDVVKGLTEPTPAQVSDPKQVEDNGLNEDKVLQLVREALNQNDQVKTVQQNINTVVSKLSETFGDKTQEVVSTRAKELGMKPSDLQKLSGDNPQLVLSLFSGLDVPKDNSPIKSSQITPKTTSQNNEIPKPERNIITEGASNEELVNEWRKAQEYTYNKLGVET